jgi:phosphoglycolate phosphatase
MIKLIIFDWDDVITLGSKEGYFKCYHQVLEDLGIQLDAEVEKRRIIAQWGKPYKEELRELLKENEHLLDKACTLFDQHFFGETFLKELTLAPGVIDLLTRLSKKYKLGVATGQHLDMLAGKIIPQFGIPEVFEKIITVHELKDVQLSKPHPHMIQEIIKKVGCLPSETVMVGDAENDVLMAIAAKVTPIVVLTGHLNREQAIQLGAKKIIDKVMDLESVL